MKTKKLGAAMLLSAALVMPLSACGNSGESGSADDGAQLSTDEACSQVKDALTELADQSMSTAADEAQNVYDDFTNKLDEIAGNSPEEVKGPLERVSEASRAIAADPTSAESSELTAIAQDLRDVCPNLSEQ